MHGSDKFKLNPQSEHFDESNLRLHNCFSKMNANILCKSTPYPTSIQKIAFPNIIFDEILYCTSNSNIKANYFRTHYTDCIFFYLHFTDCNIFVLALHFCNIFESSVSVYLLEIFETRLISTQTGSSSESVYLLEIFETRLISTQPHC